MLSTTFCLVYGQGKALYGKLGSIKEVLIGCEAEETQILTGFVIMFFFYGNNILNIFHLCCYDVM
jgi:hypothetical protein